MTGRQNAAPIMEAMERLRQNRIIPFDVPGHKRGSGNKALMEFLGEKCLSVDVNSMLPLDNLCHPSGVIREAEGLAAAAFGAENAYFMVGGTTSAVQAMILSICRRGDRIILPRNVHCSVLNALVLCGAIPVYIPCASDPRLGIDLGSAMDGVVWAMRQYPDAKAVLVNNPTYYGICSDIAGITAAAHARNMLVLADEAHGTHFYFGEDFPRDAMSAGADMASVSMHKSGGSLTQSSLLLSGPGVNADYLRQIINLTQTTSASYLLLSSLDISRRNLALEGKTKFHKVLELAEYARREINGLGGYYAFAGELIDGASVFDFDRTKLVVNTLGIGMAGIEVYDILRDEYDIQIEFGDIGNILAYISIGDKNHKNIEMLIGALADIRRRYARPELDMIHHEYIAPDVRVSPQEAFFAPRRMVELEKSEGHICAESVMCYPPGIPIVAPGERISRDIIDYLRYAKEKGCSLTGAEDMSVNYINVLAGDI